MTIPRSRLCSRPTLRRTPSLRPEIACDLAHVGVLIAEDEGHPGAVAAGARGAPDAVDVGVAITGRVEVDHVRDVVDVDAAGGDVGGDERVDLA